METYQNRAEQSQFEFYNLDSDPGEQRDLYNAEKGVVADLKLRMARSRSPNDFYRMGNLDLMGSQCNASGQLLSDGPRSVACLADPMSATQHSWQR